MSLNTGWGGGGGRQDWGRAAIIVSPQEKLVSHGKKQGMLSKDLCSDPAGIC